MYRVQRKRRSWIFYTLLFLAAFAIGLGIGYGVIRLQAARQEEFFNSIKAQQTAKPPQREDEPNLAAAVTTTVPQATETPQTGYFVMEKEGDICVFLLEADGSKRFSHKLPIVVKDLRPEDQKLFQEGIFLESKRELLELTEDFSS